MGVVQGTSHPEHVVMDAESVSGHLLPSIWTQPPAA
jgi:hypothetical protein